MYRSYEFPVSIKGVLLNEGRVVLLKNEREEWELPGGKLEAGEAPEECLAREMMEELGVYVSVGPILDSWIYEVCRDTPVFIVTYGCLAGDISKIRPSAEHESVGFFGVKDLGALNAPVGYKKSVRKWFQMIYRNFSDHTNDYTKADD